jgi:hypothetical protein
MASIKLLKILNLQISGCLPSSVTKMYTNLFFYNSIESQFYEDIIVGLGWKIIILSLGQPNFSKCWISGNIVLPFISKTYKPHDII